MCGVVAVFGLINDNVHNTFESMLAASIERGKDSTGVAGIGAKINIVKDTLLPIELMKTHAYKEGILRNKNIALIGHCRSATKGAVTKQNSHPFSHKHITLVHNGTLWNHIDTGKLKPDTDSESLCIGIAEKGIETVWSEMKGDAAIVYFDSRNSSINFITNGKRPLTFAYDKDLSTCFVASEPWIINAPTSHSGIKLRKNEVWAPKDHELWTITWDNKRKIILESSRILEPRKITSTGGTNWYYSNRSSGQSESSNMWNRWKNEKLEDKPLPLSDVAFLSDIELPTPDMTQDEFDKKYDNCSACDEPVFYTACMVVSEDIVYCKSCCKHAAANYLDPRMLRGA